MIFNDSLWIIKTELEHVRTLNQPLIALGLTSVLVLTRNLTLGRRSLPCSGMY